MLSLSCEDGIRVGYFVLWLYYNPLPKPDLMFFFFQIFYLAIFLHPFFTTESKFLSVYKLSKSLSIHRHQRNRWSWQRRRFSSMPCLYPSVYLFVFLLFFDSALSRQRNKHVFYLAGVTHFSAMLFKYFLPHHICISIVLAIVIHWEERMKKLHQSLFPLSRSGFSKESVAS